MDHNSIDGRLSSETEWRRSASTTEKELVFPEPPPGFGLDPMLLGALQWKRDMRERGLTITFTDPRKATP